MRGVNIPASRETLGHPARPTPSTKPITESGVGCLYIDPVWLFAISGQRHPKHVPIKARLCRRCFPPGRLPVSGVTRESSCAVHITKTRSRIQEPTYNGSRPSVYAEAITITPTRTILTILAITRRAHRPLTVCQGYMFPAFVCKQEKADLLRSVFFMSHIVADDVIYLPLVYQ